MKNTKIISLCSSNKKTGTTIISMQLALSISRKNYKVLLIDYDFDLNYINYFYFKEINNNLNMFNLMTNGIEDDNYTIRYNNNLDVISMPMLKHKHDISYEYIINVINSIGSNYDFILIDIGLTNKKYIINLLDISDIIYNITTLGLSNLNNTKSFVDNISKVNKDKVGIVLNKVTKNFGSTHINVQQIEKWMGNIKCIIPYIQTEELSDGLILLENNDFIEKIDLINNYII